MSSIEFIKMHGLGNDFVIIDFRKQTVPLDLTTKIVKKIADRKTGVGCDQIIAIEATHNPEADIHMSIWNGGDGSKVEACGNATRCIAALCMNQQRTNHITIETIAGLYKCSQNKSSVNVDMGLAKKVSQHKNPFCQEMDMNIGPLQKGYYVNIGNPHLVFFVKDLYDGSLEKYGHHLEHHKNFPQKTNIELAQIINNDYIKVRVWERGVGITQACGTGACASLIAAHSMNLTNKEVDVELEGGILNVKWEKNGHIIMSGPTEKVFIGYFTSEFFQ